MTTRTLVLAVGIAIAFGLTLSAGAAESAKVRVPTVPGEGRVVKSDEQVFRPGAQWLDDQGALINAHAGGMIYHDGRYYWFGQHMTAGRAGNRAQVGVHVYSSGDLYRWKDEGIALKVSDDPASEIVKDSVIERPKVIYNAKTGKFVMWFHLELRGQGYKAARSGVAIAEQVTGPYRYVGSFRPNAGAWPMNVGEELKRPLAAEEVQRLSRMQLGGGTEPGYPEDLIFRRDFEGGQMARDMNLFVDDDGSAYHVYASEENGAMQISQLTDDYLKPAGRYIRIHPGRFHEAPALFKWKGRYFLITSGCTGWAPNAARLSVAESIWGPWKEVGNPWRGPESLARISFDSQSTYVLPVVGKPGAFIFVADRWRPQNAIDGRYVWIPIRWQDGLPVLEWTDEWNLSIFDKAEFRAKDKLP